MSFRFERFSVDETTEEYMLIDAPNQIPSRYKLIEQPNGIEWYHSVDQLAKHELWRKLNNFRRKVLADSYRRHQLQFALAYSILKYILPREVIKIIIGIAREAPGRYFADIAIGDIVELAQLLSH